MEQQRLGAVAQMRGISSYHLKWIAIVSMILDHLGSLLLRPYFASGGGFIFSELSAGQEAAYWLYQGCHVLGRMAFPLFAFLIVQGFIHTRSVGKYALRLGAFALLSEIPYDLANHSVWLEFSLQNVLFTLTIGLLTLEGLRRLDRKDIVFMARMVCRVLVILTGMAAAFLVRGEYVFLGVLAMSLFYLCRDKKWLQTAAGLLPLLVVSPWVLLDVLPLWFYNGQRGRGMKYFFYVFYPAHLLLLVGIAVLAGLRTLP